MNEENALKWIDGLKSGKYIQGRLKLNKENTEFCCFGVLCEVAMNNKVNCHKIESHDIYRKSHYLYNGEGTSPPLVVREWILGRIIENVKK